MKDRPYTTYEYKSTRLEEGLSGLARVAAKNSGRRLKQVLTPRWTTYPVMKRIATTKSVLKKVIRLSSRRMRRSKIGAPP